MLCRSELLIFKSEWEQEKRRIEDYIGPYYALYDFINEDKHKLIIIAYMVSVLNIINAKHKRFERADGFHIQILGNASTNMKTNTNIPLL